MEFPKRASDTGVRLSPIQGKGLGLSRARVREWAGVVLLVVVALLLRLDFMRGGSFVIDSDEAIVGLMGKHILEVFRLFITVSITWDLLRGSAQVSCFGFSARRLLPFSLCRLSSHSFWFI